MARAHEIAMEFPRLRSRLDAPEAEQYVEPADLDAAVEEMLAKVVGHTPTVLAAQKRLFETWQNTGTNTGIEVSIEEFAGVFGAPDTKEALARYRAERGIS